MTKYKFTANLNKWMHQNNGEIIDAIEGTLLDSLLISTKRGTALLLETYETPNSSTYTLYFSTNGEAEELFYTIQEEREAER